MVEQNVFRKRLIPCGINAIYRIVARVDIGIVGDGSAGKALHRVSCPEPSGGLVVVSISKVVEADAAVRPLTAVEEAVGGGTARFDRHPKRVIVIRIGDCSGSISEDRTLPCPS